MWAPIATRLAGAAGAAILLGGCCVRAVASSVSDDDRRMLDAHVKAGRCVVTGAASSVSDVDVVWAAAAIERAGVFAEVLQAPVGTRATSDAPRPQLEENAEWLVELERADVGRALNGFWDITFVHFVTLGVIPLVESGDNVMEYRIRRGDQPRSAGREVIERVSRGAVCGWISLPLSLLPAWEMDRATLAESRNDDRFAVDLLKTMAEALPSERDR